MGVMSHMAYSWSTNYTEMRDLINEKSLPLVNIKVDYGALNTESFINGEIEIADYLKRTEGQEIVKYKCKLRIRGVWASTLEKKSFAVKLTDQNGEKLNVSIFGIRPEDSWILDAMAVDRIRMRNRVCFDLWNEIDKTPYQTKYDNRNGTLGQFVEVYINDVYQGLYCFTDKINRKLLNLKKYDKETETVRGILYKGESSRRAGHDLLSYDEADFNQKSWNAWNLQYPEDYPSIKTWQPLMNLIDLCSFQTSDTRFVEEYQNFFYVDNIINYYVMTMALNVDDNLYKNTILSVPNILDGHRFLYSPWDMDYSLGGRYNGEYEDELTEPHRYDNRAPFDRLYGKGLDDFLQKVVRKWNELKESTFSVEHVYSILDTYMDQFVTSGAWEREYEKWNGIPVELQQDLSVELDYVKDWYKRNHDMLCYYWKDTSGILATRRVTAKQAPFVYLLDGRKKKLEDHKKLPRKGVFIYKGEKHIEH